MFKFVSYGVLFYNLVLCNLAVFTKEDCTKEGRALFPCRRNPPVYRWNDEMKMCEEDIYGGCQPTKNTFETLEECYAVAEPVCKEFTEEDCSKDIQEDFGPCKAFFYRYKWDVAQQKCIRAIYGGCDPTPNNFPTLESCEETAVPVCEKRNFTKEDCGKEVEGFPTCHGDLSAFRWDVATQQCKEVPYGGCGPTENNFRFFKQCERIARPVCQGIFFTKEDCKKDVEDGLVPCRANARVYKWDDEKQKCVEAIFGGCNATPNNFQEKEDCENVAGHICPGSNPDKPWIWPQGAASALS